MTESKCTHCPYYIDNVAINDSEEDWCLGCIGNICEYAGDKCQTCCYEPLDDEEDLRRCM